MKHLWLEYSQLHQSCKGLLFVSISHSSFLYYLSSYLMNIDLTEKVHSKTHKNEQIYLTFYMQLLYLWR